MTRLRALGYIITIISLTLGLLSLSGEGSQAATWLSITETPTLAPTDTPVATLTSTPPATLTDTPIPTDTPTPVTPTRNPAPDPSYTPTPTGTLLATPLVTPTGSLPPDTTPMGTFTLPQSGQSNPLPVSLLLVVAGGLLALWAWLLRQSSHHS